MSEYNDAVVFIDRREAKVFHFSADDDLKLVFEHTSAHRPHHEADHEDATKHAVDDGFMATVVASLGTTGCTLIVGPGNAKFELQTYIVRTRPDLAVRISGVETLSNPQDSGILALAREFFRKRGHRHAVAPEFSFRHN
jgi:stalled ribosome rescue protein Dom34